MPQRAVQRSADGSAQVLVIDTDDVVQSRPVHTGAMYGAQWHITQGLQAADRVVVGGNAAPGTKVKVTEKDGAPPAAPTLPAASTTLAPAAKTV